MNRNNYKIDWLIRTILLTIAGCSMLGAIMFAGQYGIEMQDQRLAEKGLTLEERVK